MFLRKEDYDIYIRNDKLEVILQNNTPAVRENVELGVDSHIRALLGHRYDMDKILIDILPFALATPFKISDLIEYSETTYDNSTTYSDGDRVSYSFTSDNITYDYIYEALEEVTGEAPNTSSKWSYITENKSLYTCIVPSAGNLPDTAFAYSASTYSGEHNLILGWDRTKTLYFKEYEGVIRIFLSAADRTANTNYIGVVSNDPKPETYPSLREISAGIHLDTKLSGRIALTDFIPDDQTWEVSTSNYFEKKDARNQLILRCFIKMAIYELHSLISPRNIPDFRINGNDESVEILRQIAKGAITADLPTYEQIPNRGQRVIYGSSSSTPYKY